MNKDDAVKIFRMFYKRQLGRLAALQAGGIRKQVLFESYGGRQYSDNPRFISEKMHELYPDYTLVWGAADPKKAEGYPSYVRVLKVDTPEYRKAMAQSAAVVRNEAMRRSLYKRPGQLFIQTWHGDRGIKKILFDSLEARGVSEKSFGFCDGQVTDLFVVGSDYAEKRIQTAFRYHGETLKAGCPRNDCLVSPVNTEKVRQSLGIAPGQKVLLYAPTLRRNQKVFTAKVDLQSTLRALETRGGSWVCLVRAHPKALGLEVGQNTGVVDVSAWPDMADLLMIADVLITDYSSCAGDFILRSKPVILAQFDLEQYLEEDRTFHADPREIGYLIANDQAQLEQMLTQMTDEQFAENCRKVASWFGACETGCSAEAVCRWIDEKYRQRNTGR